MNHRIALFIAPIAAVIVTMHSTFGSGAEHPVDSVRIYGTIPYNVSPVSIRIQTLRTWKGATETLQISDIQAQLFTQSQTLASWSGSTDENGVAELWLTFTNPAPENVQLRMTKDSAIQFERALSFSVAASPVKPREEILRGTSKGPMQFRITPTRGILAAPFSETLFIDVTSLEKKTPIYPLTVQLQAIGAIVQPTQTETDVQGRAIVSIQPNAHDIELTITASSKDTSIELGQWTGRLAVHPGAMWLKETSEAFEIVSPAPNRRAYVSFYSATQRVYGASVSLVENQGFFRGILNNIPKTILQLPHLHATVSSSPDERSAGTVSWPIRPPEGQIPTSTLSLLYDSLPIAQNQERKRASKARQTSAIVISALGITEILIMARLYLLVGKAKRLPGATFLLFVTALGFAALASFLLIKR